MKVNVSELDVYEFEVTYTARIFATDKKDAERQMSEWELDEENSHTSNLRFLGKVKDVE